MSGWRAGRSAAAAAILLAAGCRPLSDEQAVAVVLEYDRRVAQAHRLADPRLVEEVCGDAEARKLAGLIGVKLDMGYTLDAQLLDLVPLGVERQGDAVVVSTQERWYYRDRRVGTGEQLGQDSTDRYRMRYHLGRREGRWVVERTEFADPPQVGRTLVNAGADPRAFHGLPAEGPGAAGRGPPVPGREAPR